MLKFIPPLSLSFSMIPASSAHLGGGSALASFADQIAALSLCPLPMAETSGDMPRTLSMLSSIAEHRGKRCRS
jgi:hypothetical protein